MIQAIRLLDSGWLVDSPRVHSKMAMRSPNNMVEVGEIEQFHPTRLKQGGKLGTIENIWTMRTNSRSKLGMGIAAHPSTSKPNE